MFVKVMMVLHAAAAAVSRVCGIYFLTDVRLLDGLTDLMAGPGDKPPLIGAVPTRRGA